MHYLLFSFNSVAKSEPSLVLVGGPEPLRKGLAPAKMSGFATLGSNTISNFVLGDPLSLI